MQTLKAGSFLHLENETSLESLKFTARLLAEHTTSVIKENLNSQSLATLTDNLWQKAEYVTRETERRKLQQIFTENFTERFRELKPEVFLSTADLIFQSLEAPVSHPSNQAQITAAESVTQPAVPTDEFLGIVKTDPPVSQDSNGTGGDPIKADPQPETEESIKKEHLADSVSIEREAHVVTETSVSPVISPSEVPAENQLAESLVKPSTKASIQLQPVAKTENGTEPFEFGKCKVALNLVLLPGSGNERWVLISAASHDLPPEIEYLKINDCEDLEQIAGLVKAKLERFKQTLPVKYIEQLRTAKNKGIKPTPRISGEEPAKNLVVGDENTGQSGGEEKRAEMIPAISQPAANDVQGSLF